MTCVLLLGAGGSAAANVGDALRRADRGYRLIGADASNVKLHLSTADERIVVPRSESSSYVDAISRAVKEWDCDVVHPQPDPDVMAISAARDRIGARTYMPTHEVLEVAGDKLRFAQQMRAAGVSVPEAENYESLSRVVDVTDQLLTKHERVWVRARTGAGGRASLPVRTGAQADAWIRWWIDERGMTASQFMVSEMLPGREFAYQSVWQDGELVAGQARERVEYLYGHLTPSGQTSTPSVARTVREPAVGDLAIRSIRALDPRPCGAYCVDIKESAAGVPNVTEINAGRFFTTSNFFAAAGLNMPDMLIRCALGEQLTAIGSSPLDADLYWIRMVDMGFVLVPGTELDRFPRFDAPDVSHALGNAVISDFDGTIARLVVPWESLRETLSIERILDLWNDPDDRRWAAITEAEIDAARTADPVPHVVEALAGVPTIAVLTNNDEGAVTTFLDRWPELRARVRIVVGRRALAGPKTDFDVFSAGYATCRHALAGAGDPGPEITYVGDMRYELEFARRLGARAVDAQELAAGWSERGREA